MARTRPTSDSIDPPEEPTRFEDVESPVPADPAPVVAEVAPEPPAAPAEPRKELPVERAFAGRDGDPMIQAFITTEKLRGGKPRRQTRQEWNDELKAFVAAPR